MKPVASATQPLQSTAADMSGGGGGKSMGGSLGGERSNVMAASVAGNDSIGGGGVSSGALEDTAAVLRTMREMNEAQTVRNEDIFGPVTNESVVIAIQGLALSLTKVVRRINI